MRRWTRARYTNNDRRRVDTPSGSPSSASEAASYAAARASASGDMAKRYYRELTLLVAEGANRPEVLEAKSYLAQN